MKNKKLIYILLPAVIIIWALIFIKFFNGIKTPAESFNLRSNISNADTSKFWSDTIRLIADYRDPFLPGNTLIETSKTSEVKQNQVDRAFKPRRKELQQNSLNWPEINYPGIIYNNNKTKNTALVIIQQRNYLISEGDSVGDLFFTGVYIDSIAVKYKTEIRTIKRKK